VYGPFYFGDLLMAKKPTYEELEQRVKELENGAFQRKKTEEAPRRNEGRFSTMFKHMSSGVAVYESVDNGEDFVFRDLNPAAERITRISRSEVLGNRLLDLFPHMEKSGLLGALQRVWKTGQEEHLPPFFYKDEKREGWRENRIYKLPTGEVIALFDDITERKRAEQALRENAKEYRSMLDDLLVGVILHAGDTSILLSNPEATNILGLTFEQMSGKKTIDPVWNFLHEDLTVMKVEDYPVSRVFSTRKPIHDYVLGINRPDRDYVTWVIVNAIPVFSKDNELEKIVVNFVDITPRKKSEQERELLISELEVKNAELERFTYTVSHDLKSPLITIKGFLGMLEKDAIEGNTERMKADMVRISGAAEKMHRLLDELLELSRIGRLVNPPEKIPMVDLAHESLSMLAGRMVDDLEVEIAPDLPMIYGDRLRMREVLENLITNAGSFMGSQTKPRIELGARQKGGETIFYVRDNGIGIDPKYHEKVFGLFDKLDQNTEGTGVGLTIVKQIVEVHGGRIWVESEGIGKGTTFCFTIPDKNELKVEEE